MIAEVDNRQFQFEHGVVMYNITCLSWDSKSDSLEGNRDLA